MIAMAGQTASALRQAQELERLGRLQDAAMLYESTARQPELPAASAVHVWRELSRMLTRQNALKGAINALLEAVSRDPHDAETLFDLGNLLYRAGDTEAAISAFEQAVRLAPDNPAVWHNLGNAQAAVQTLDEAEASFREAVRLDPDDKGFLRSLASQLLQSGKKAEACEAYSKLVVLDPSSGSAHLNLVELQRFEPGDRRIAHMEACLANPALPNEDRTAFGFALFKVYDGHKDHRRAFDCLETANRLKRSAFHFDPSTEMRVFEEMRQFFTRDFFAARAGLGFDEIAPIFILGVPRSGTTLTEQILSSHSDVAAGGESVAMTDLVGAVFGSSTSQGLVFSEEAFLPERCVDFGRQYAHRMRAVAGARPRFTDKMPLNFRWIGIMAAVFPRARFVHCSRQAVENCFSIYSSYFVSNGNRYAYDQAELGAYYRHYSSLMDHWQAVLPERLHEMRLEEVVADQEGQTRALLDFCGLEFEPACLEFHQNANRVKTLSALQVRKPIYTGHSDRLKPYLPFLDRLITALGPLA
jgi:Flp pilus assembly protein TadD